MSARVELLIYADVPVRLPDLPSESDPAGEVGARSLQPPRPGSDTRLHGDDAAAALHLESATSVCSLTVRAADLDAAHLLAADIAEQVVALTTADALAAGVTTRISIVDVLALDAREATSAIARLRSGEPSTRLWIGVRPDGDQRFVAETFGLRKLGLCEVHVPMLGEEHLGAVLQFLNKLAHYAAVTGTSIDADHSVSFGWVDLRLRPAGRAAPRFMAEATADTLPGVLLAYESTSDEDDASYTPGARRAASLMNQLTAACHHCGIERGIDVPRAHATAVVCTRVPEATEVHARRTAPDDALASGWVAVCGHDHDHDAPESFVVVPLRELCLCVPRLFPMLGAPIGTGLSVSGDDELTIHLPEGI